MKDGADHRRLRTLAHKAFMPTRVAALEHRIAQLTDGLLDVADARGTMDLIADLALPLPVAVISDMRGVDERHQRHFHLRCVHPEGGGGVPDSWFGEP